MLIVHIGFAVIGLALLYWRKPVARWAVREQNRLWHIRMGGQYEVAMGFGLAAMGLIFVVTSIASLLW